MLPLSLGRIPPGRLTQPDARKRRSKMASADLLERRAFSSWATTLVVLAVVIALAHVWLRLQVSETGYELEATHQAIDRLRQEANDLTAQVAALNSPARLESLAQSRLGLSRPQKGQEAVLP
ncbi:MAG TPA: cell division protein FtsL [Candidatus Acidoferrales bacterium]|nr:cell division protein FtsL [Candidatus Acidoferrales bacterium]